MRIVLVTSTVLDVGHGNRHGGVYIDGGERNQITNIDNSDPIQ